MKLSLTGYVFSLKVAPEKGQATTVPAIPWRPWIRGIVPLEFRKASSPRSSSKQWLACCNTGVIGRDLCRGEPKCCGVRIGAGSP